MRNDFDGAEWIAQIEKDGFLVIRDFLDPAAVMRTREELVALLDEDEVLRGDSKAVRGGVTYEAETAEHPRSVFNNDQHMLFFPTAFSPALRELIETIISHPQMKLFTDRVIGKNYRLRVDYVRRLTGINDTVDDFELPHEWHRDNPGAFTFGIFFDDVTPSSSGATIGIKGTHWTAYDPRYDILMSKRSYISPALRAVGGIGEKAWQKAWVSNLLQRRLKSKVVEMAGKPGDIYFFLNDAWHGRAPNVHGTRNIILRFNGFPSDYTPPENVPLPKAAASFGGEMQKRYSRQQEVNTDPTTLIWRLKKRKPRLDLFTVAALEKRLLVKIGQRMGWVAAQLPQARKPARTG